MDDQVWPDDGRETEVRLGEPVRPYDSDNVMSHLEAAVWTSVFLRAQHIALARRALGRCDERRVMALADWLEGPTSVPWQA